MGLREPKENLCLSFDKRQSLAYGSEIFAVVLTHCNGSTSMLWQAFGAGRLMNIEAKLCMDANDMVTPILITCYDTSNNVLTQHFELHKNGKIEVPRSWADNGRKQYPAKCLDSKPVAPAPLTTLPCDMVKRKKTVWEKVWEETPLETRLFQEAVAKQ